MAQPVRVLGSLFQALHAGVALAGVLALLAALHPLVPLALAVSGAPVLLLRLRRARRLYAWRRDQAPLEREAGYFHHLLTDGAYAQEMRLYGHGPFCRARFERVRARLRLARLAARVAAPTAPQAVPRPLRQGIVFDRVTFAYPGTERTVLRDVSFVLHPGERLALAGANGSGKSTVVKLLARLYDPLSGRILVDGVDLRDCDPAAWRRRIGMVVQDFGRYQWTVAENIAMGDPAGADAAPRVAAAAADAGLGEALRAWQRGLDAPLGRWLHEGTEPSVGQWQRIALARAGAGRRSAGAG